MEKKIGIVYAYGCMKSEPDYRLYAVSPKIKKDRIEIQLIKSKAPLEKVKEDVKASFGFDEVEVICHESYYGDASDLSLVPINEDKNKVM